ncbi:transposase [Rhodococcus sp. 14C212]|uniref:transposase n=1 Tax=Rhodococcus sp. 14C212 TaxID=2711209 RepID=UPI003211D5F4
MDEHRWAHIRHATTVDGYIRRRRGPGAGVRRHWTGTVADLGCPGRSSAALTTWLDRQRAAFRDGIQVLAKDGFGGYNHAATSAVPDAVTVMDPFHVVALASTKLDLCRQRGQQHTYGHHGRSGDPLYGVRCPVRTRQELLSDRQRRGLESVFAEEQHLPFAVTWRVYQDVIDAYSDHDRPRGKERSTWDIDMICSGVPDGLDQLGRPLHRRHNGLLTYFDFRASDGPTGAINGRLEALRATLSGSGT